MKEFFKIIQKIITVFIIIYLILISVIALDGLTYSKNQKETKYAIVYGSKVEQNGNISERLKARLDKSLELYNKKIVKKIIVSGGKGESGYNEAEIMQKYLINNGVKIPRIFLDKNGNNTLLTSKNSYKIIKDLGEYPDVGVIGVSQFFHCSRVKLSLKKSGFSSVDCVSPSFYELRDVYSLLRELPAYIKYYFMGIEQFSIDKNELEKLSEKVLDKLKK